MLESVFENPVYYVGNRKDPLNTPAFLTLFGNALNATIAEAASSGKVASRVIKLIAEAVLKPANDNGVYLHENVA